MPTKKHLGQHWLKDRYVLDHIADCADVGPDDVVLEVGPGLGTLTSVLLARAKKVIAVEFDKDLARKLPGQFPGKNLDVVHSDILEFDMRGLPEGYKVVANIPYYITSKIIQKFMTSEHKPSVVTLLIQKEVAERVAAAPGNMSILAIGAQLYADASLGDVVPAEFFTPPPKVDSQVVTLRTRPATLPVGVDEQLIFRLVKAGFSAKRKKLRTSIGGGLGIDKAQVEVLLREANISPDDRAEALSIEQWKNFAAVYSARHRDSVT